MGGIVCNIFHNAIVIDPNSDAQWRAFFAVGDVAQSVVNETGDADKLCKILAQPVFSASDKAWLHGLAKSLWAGYQ